MSDAPHLSVAMIVRNEADTICATLDAIQSIADEIVVYDTSDDDSTMEAAASYDTIWIDAEWTDDFSAARNGCWDRARGAWILWLNSGESISAEDAASLQAFVDTEADVEKVYMLIVETLSGDQSSEAEQVGQLRLMPNRPELRFRGRVRESVEAAAMTLGLSLEGLPQRIRRGTHCREPDRLETRGRRDLQLADMEVAAGGPSAKMSIVAGAAHHDLKQFEEAARCYAKAVDTAARGSAESLEAYYGLLSTLDLIPESLDRQVQLCLQALDVFPVDAQLLCAMGGYLQRQNRIDLAARSYETAYRFGQVNPVVSHVGRIHEISAVCYALALQLEGKDQDSLRILQEAAAQYPESEALQRQRLNSLIRQGMRDEALACADQLAPADANSLRSAIRGACLAAEENWLAANAYLKIAFESGCRDPLCLRWYCIVLLRQGLVDEARAVMDAWEEVEAGNVELQSYRELIASEDGGAAALSSGRRLDGSQSVEQGPGPQSQTSLEKPS